MSEKRDLTIKIQSMDGVHVKSNALLLESSWLLLACKTPLSPRSRRILWGRWINDNIPEPIQLCKQANFIEYMYEFVSRLLCRKLLNYVCLQMALTTTFCISQFRFQHDQCLCTYSGRIFFNFTSFFVM